VKYKVWSGSYAPITKGVGSVNPLDIIVHLGRTPRFGGGGDTEWTVLHHAKLCEYIWLRMHYPVEELVYASIHDDHEAYLGDIPSPIKRLINHAAGKDVCRTLEKEVDDRILNHIHLPPPGPAVKARVKTVDKLALIVESIIFGPPGYNALDDESAEERLRLELLLESIFPGFLELVYV